jgi:hypothetical protein
MKVVCVPFITRDGLLIQHRQPDGATSFEPIPSDSQRFGDHFNGGYRLVRLAWNLPATTTDGC